MLVSVRGAVAYPFWSWPGMLARVASGRLPIERIAGRRVTLEDAVADGFEPLSRPDVGELKVLVEVNARG